MSWHFKQLTASICCHKVISCSQLSHLSVFMFYHVSILSADPSSQLHHPSFHSLRSPPNFHWYPFSSNCLHSLFVRTRRHAGTCLFSPSTLILNSPPPPTPPHSRHSSHPYLPLIIPELQCQFIRQSEKQSQMSQRMMDEAGETKDGREEGGRERGTGEEGENTGGGGGGDGAKWNRRRKGRYASLERLLACTERDGGGDKDWTKGTSGKMIHISPGT